MGTLIWLVLADSASADARLPAHRPADVHDRARGSARRLLAVRRRRFRLERAAARVVRAARGAERRNDSPRQRHAPPVRALPQHAAEHVEDRAGSARSRQRLVGRRAVHGHARLAPAQESAAAEADARGAGVPRRPDRGALPHPRRLADHARARRHAAERLGVHQGEEILRDDHPEAVRRPRVLAARELDGVGEDRVAQRDRGFDDRRAELARPRGAPAALRHRGAEAALAAAPRERRRDPVLRADLATRRLRRDGARRQRRRSAKARGKAKRSSAFA